MSEEKYTQKAREALQNAQQITALNYQQEINTAHLLLALAKEPEGILEIIFQDLNTDLNLLKIKLEQIIKRQPAVTGYDSQFRMSTALYRVLALAENIAKEIGIDIISVTDANPLSKYKEYLEKRIESNANVEFEETNVEKRIDPKLLLESAKSIIAVGISYNTGYKAEINTHTTSCINLFLDIYLYSEYRLIYC